MKSIVLLAVLCSFALADAKLVMGRLPLNLLLSGKFKPYEADDRIVGGSEVTPNSLPFQISMQRLGNQYCGGSVISSTKILCAAHCTVNLGLLGNYEIVAGEHSLSQNSGNEQRRDISSVDNHPQYNGNTQANDVSVITLSSPLTLNSVVATIRLTPQGQDTAAGTQVTVSGWGTLSSGGSIPDRLQSVDVLIVSDAECRSAYGATNILSGMICAAARGKDSCQGDSGGPLFTGTGSSATQVGIVSWGRGCADAAYPGVYTEVSSYTNWINQQL